MLRNSKNNFEIGDQVRFEDPFRPGVVDEGRITAKSMLTPGAFFLSDKNRKLQGPFLPHNLEKITEEPISI
jgi:hypothetical protein